MIIYIPAYYNEFKFNLNDYILKNLSEKSKILISRYLPTSYLVEIVREIRIEDLKYKIYKYKSLRLLFKDYFSSDVSGILFKSENGYFGLTPFNLDKIFSSNEYFLYEFYTYNEREIDKNKIMDAISQIREVDISHYTKYKLYDNFVLEIEFSRITDYVVNLIDKFYYAGMVFPFFDIHYYRLNSIDNVNYYFLFTYHPNISSSGSVCYGKKEKSVYNLSRLEMNYSSAYNSGIRFTSYRVNKQLIKQIIENGGGLDV